MSRICPLFSGSTGNSTYIASSLGGILIDAGASMRGICYALERAGGDYKEIKAVAVTHTHSDHIKGLKTFLSRTDAVLIATKDTAESLCSDGVIPSGTEILIAEDKPIIIGGMEIKSFTTNHDCKGSCGYTVTLPDAKKISVCTDLGVVTDNVREAITGSDVILLESNHDLDMLKNGPYPMNLKIRIMSDCGHISNPACAAELKNLIKSGTQRFILGHLSQHNNTPLIAKTCAESVLMDMGAVNGRDYLLSVASPKDNGVTVI